MSLKYFFKQIIPIVAVCTTLNYSSCFYSNNSSGFSKINSTTINNSSIDSVSVSKNKVVVSNLEDKIATSDHSVNVSTNSNSIISEPDDYRAYIRHMQLQTIKNHDYILTVSKLAYGDSIVYSNSLLDKINLMLTDLEHSSALAKTKTVASNVADSSMTVDQKLCVYSMLNALTSNSFCNTIGRMIAQDVSDIYAEYGGVVLFNKNNAIKFKGILSELPRHIDNNSFYFSVPSNINFPFIALYHLHASTYDEKDFAGPSCGDLNFLGYPDVIGHSHEFVITSLSKGKFNIDYYGTYFNAIKGRRILDLGNYSYTLDDVDSVSK